MTENVMLTLFCECGKSLRVEDTDFFRHAYHKETGETVEMTDEDFEKVKENYWGCGKRTDLRKATLLKTPIPLIL
jgi:hypothetical protein